MNNQAVWIIGHGSSRSEWIDYVDKLVEKIDSRLPLILSFLEKVERRLIPDGIEKLRQLQVDQVFVIPLFVSSGSTHIDEIQTILFEYKEEFQFEMGSSMDDHPLVAQHIIRQAEELSNNPKEETVLIIGHGSDQGHFLERWTEVLDHLVKQVEKRTKFCNVKYATFLPNTISERLEEMKQENQETQTICIPLFLSKGIFTDKKIPEAIQAYSVRYNGKAYLPNPWIAGWLQEQVDQIQSKEIR